MIDHPRSPADFIANAREKLASLRAERADRKSNNHPDSRVPGEILREQINLSRIQYENREYNQRMIEATQVNTKQIKEAEEVYLGLQEEMDVAIKRQSL